MADARTFLSALNIPDTPKTLQPPAQDEGLSYIEFRGEVIHKSEDAIILLIGNTRYGILMGDIKDIEKDDAEPSPDQAKGTSVRLKLAPDTVIDETRTVTAGDLGGVVGMRPLAFALPSRAGEYALIDQGASLAARSLGSVTVTNTTYLTPQTTPYATGNTIDTKQDTFNDSSIDQNKDD